MVRLACINVPSIDLQILLKENPDWIDSPVAVVTEDKPLGTITQISQKAKEAGISIGMKFATALAAAPYLRAGAITEETIQEGNKGILETLFQFSPEIEPFDLLPGIFWMNASGLVGIYGSLASWISSIQEKLERIGFRCRVCIGFTRFGSFVGAKLSRQPLIFLTRGEENKFLNDAPISTLPMNPKEVVQLKDLGIGTVGGLCEIPLGGITKRFCKETVEWHRFASGGLSHPLQPTERREDLVLYKRYLHPVKNSQSLMHNIEHLLDHLLTDVMKHGELVHDLRLCLHMEDGAEHIEVISPAKPTVHYEVLSRLLWLSIESIVISAGVIAHELSAERIRANQKQLTLFAEKTDRDLDKGAEAFALIRAELGNDSIQIASLKQVHIPEEQYEWVNLQKPKLPLLPAAEEETLDWSSPTARNQVKKHLVRRIYRSPIPYKSNRQISPLNSVSRKGHEKGHLGGPYSVSTGWWDNEARRDYHYIQAPDNEILWIYWDRSEEQWMVQGSV